MAEKKTTTMWTSWVDILGPKSAMNLANKIEEMLRRWGIEVQENLSSMIDFIPSGRIPWVLYDAQNPQLAVAPNSTPKMFELMECMVEGGSDVVAVVNRPRNERVDIYCGPISMVGRAVPEISRALYGREGM